MKSQIPSKVIFGNTIGSPTVVETYTFDDGTGDPYLNSPIKWRVTIDIPAAQTHPSHLTRIPNIYNGIDINVGDWVAGQSGSGDALRIDSIESKSDVQVVCILEDVDRYNRFHFSSANGFLQSAFIVIFEVDPDGFPDLFPVPTTLANNLIDNLQARFKQSNPTLNFRFEQENHGFNVGDQIVMNESGFFEEASQTNLDIVGRVSEIGPGPDIFKVVPVTRIDEKIKPPLPGVAGQKIYLDGSVPGGLTTDNSTQKIAYIQLTDPVPSFIEGSVSNPTSTRLYRMEVNGVEVEFTTDPDTNNVVELADMITDINALTGSHGVVASVVTLPTFVDATITSPFTDVNTPITATFNGTLVTFSSNTGGFAFIENLEQDINALTGTHGLVAGRDPNNTQILRITNPSGGPINIVDIDPLTGAPMGNRKSFLDTTGMPAMTAASTDQIIRLQENNGDEIIIVNVIGDPIGDLGIYSVENGRLPIGLIVDQTLRQRSNFIVDNITERDALSVIAGDRAFVLDKGDGEYGDFVWTGSQWLVNSTEESARTDSDTISVTIDSTTSVTPIILGEVSGGSRPSPVTVEVVIPFDGNPSIKIGDITVDDRFFDDTNVDFSTAGVYASTPSFQYPEGPDVNILVEFDAGGATVGQAIVTVSYS